MYNVGKFIFTSCPASKGIYSMIASLTLHLLSSASSTMAGKRDWESWLIPITAKHNRNYIKPAHLLRLHRKDEAE